MVFDGALCGGDVGTAGPGLGGVGSELLIGGFGAVVAFVGGEVRKGLFDGGWGALLDAALPSLLNIVRAGTLGGGLLALGVLLSMIKEEDPFGLLKFDLVDSSVVLALLLKSSII